MKLSIVIPVYNEIQFIGELLRRVQSVRLKDVDTEVIVVDDASTDGTREFLQKMVRAQAAGRPNMPLTTTDDLPIGNISVLFQEKNCGKGAALRRGFAEASGDVVIVQDADLEYDPNEYERLLEPIRRDVADVVYGSRFLGGPHRVLFFYHYLGNWFLTLLSNALTNVNLTDMETGYKVFRRDLLQRVSIEQNRFGVEPEITAKVAKLGCRIYEVPIAYYGRTYREGKKIVWKDGLQAIWCIIKYNLFHSAKR